VIYKSIADRLRLRLNSSDYNVGSPLPGEKALALEFGVARMTIRKALDLLVSWGWLSADTAAERLCRAKTSTMKPPI
jgi:DNA-binding GntR family transcriptional regulator